MQRLQCSITQQFVQIFRARVLPIGFSERERERLKDQDLFIAILGSWSRHAQLAGHTSNDRHIKCYQTAAVRGLVFLMRPHALQSQSVLHNNIAYNASWMQGFCNEHSNANLILRRVWTDATLDLLGLWLHCPFFLNLSFVCSDIHLMLRELKGSSCELCKRVGELEHPSCFSLLLPGFANWT